MHRLSSLCALTLVGCAAVDPDTTPTPTPAPDPVCQVPADAPMYDPGDEVHGTLDGMAWWRFEVADDTDLFLDLALDDVAPDDTVPPATLRICSPDGEVWSWAAGTPFWAYTTAHHSMTAALMRRGGTWGIEIEAGDDVARDYTMSSLWTHDTPGTSTQAAPSSTYAPAGMNFFNVSTFEEPNRSSWVHVTSDCLGCRVFVVGGMGTPGADAVARYTWRDGDTVLETVVDPAPESGGDEVLMLAATLPDDGRGLLLEIGERDGRSGDDAWATWFLWVYPNQ